MAKRFGYIVVVSVLPKPRGKGRAAHRRHSRSHRRLHDARYVRWTGRRCCSMARRISVKLAVVRRGTTEPQTVDVPRAVLPPQHVTADKIDDDVAYVRLPTLDAGAAAELRDKLQQLDRQGLHKLVLDLRDCASGPISEGIAAAQLFLSSGKIATLKGQTVSRRSSSPPPTKSSGRIPSKSDFR